MATVTINNKAGAGDGSSVSFQWTLTTADATGDGIEFMEWADVTWLFDGQATWGGATAKIQGSADNVTWVTTGLNAAAGGAEATASADKVLTIIERPRFIRPKLTTGGTLATVIVTALARRATPLRT